MIKAISGDPVNLKAATPTRRLLLVGKLPAWEWSARQARKCIWRDAKATTH